MNYIIKTNDITVIQDKIVYNLLAEFYPTIKEKYYYLWFLQNIASLSSEVKEKKIKRIQKEIAKKFSLYNIPKEILFFENKDGSYYEPITKTKYNLYKPKSFKKTSDKYAAKYICDNEDNYFFKETMPKFKKLVLNKGRK